MTGAFSRSQIHFDRLYQSPSETAQIVEGELKLQKRKAAPADHYSTREAQRIAVQCASPSSPLQVSSRLAMDTPIPIVPSPVTDRHDVAIQASC